MLFIFCSITAQNDYLPIVVENKHWIYHGCGTLSGGHSFLGEHLIRGDTTINDINYKKLFWREFDIYDSTVCEHVAGLNPVNPPYEIISSEYVGAIREDESKKVWLKPHENPWTVCHSDTEEFLLFDFGLEVGDTTFVCAGESPSGYNPTIESIETAFIWGQERRILRTSFDFLIFAEGVGYSGLGLRDHWSLIIQVDCGYNNIKDICVGTDEICLFTNTSVENIIDQNLNIYPNPSTGNFTIEFADISFEEKPDLRIYNQIGVEVFRKNDLSDSHEIEENFDSGLYFISILHEGVPIHTEKHFIIK